MTTETRALLPPGVGLLAVDGSASCFRVRGALVGWSYWCHAARCVSEWEYLLLRRGHWLVCLCAEGSLFPPADDGQSVARLRKPCARRIRRRIGKKKSSEHTATGTPVQGRAA